MSLDDVDAWLLGLATRALRSSLARSRRRGGRAAAIAAKLEQRADKVLELSGRERTIDLDEQRRQDVLPAKSVHGTMIAAGANGVDEEETPDETGVLVCECGHSYLEHDVYLDDVDGTGPSRFCRQCDRWCKRRE